MMEFVSWDDSPIYEYGSKLGTPKLWMVNTKLDIHICGPTSVFHFDPHPYEMENITSLKPPTRGFSR